MVKMRIEFNMKLILMITQLSFVTQYGLVGIPEML